jgi:hypothetical protein
LLRRAAAGRSIVFGWGGWWPLRATGRSKQRPYVAAWRKTLTRAIVASSRAGCAKRSPVVLFTIVAG